MDHGPALEVADQLVLMKRLVKGCAVEHGYLASFMAKTSLKSPGSGLHLHCSMQDSKGVNLFALEDDKALRNCVIYWGLTKIPAPRVRLSCA